MVIIESLGVRQEGKVTQKTLKFWSSERRIKLA